MLLQISNRIILHAVLYLLHFTVRYCIATCRFFAYTVPLDILYSCLCKKALKKVGENLRSFLA
jgi:hypothetical protein